MSHVALVIPTLDRIGGAERQVMLLARGLKGMGWRVSVVALAGTGGAARQQLSAQGIDFFSLEMRKGLADLRGWMRMHRWLRAHRPAIVHAHLAHAAWMARWSRLAAAVPVQIDTLHTSSTGTLGRGIGYRISRGLPDRVTAVSRAVADAHLRAGMVAEDRILVMPNGVDAEAFRPDRVLRQAHRARLGVTGEFVWFTAGRLDAVKDYPTLLAAFERLPAGARLLIAGEGPQRSLIEEKIRQSGLSGRIQLLGFQPDLRPFFAAADGFVLASRWEGLPMALLEAGASGLPAVATDVAGTREAMIPAETGWLAPPGNANALADAMIELQRASPPLRQRMGARAVEFVLQNFDEKAVVKRWSALYRQLLEAARK